MTQVKTLNADGQAMLDAETGADKLMTLPVRPSGSKAAPKTAKAAPGSRFNRPTQEDLALYAESKADRDHFIENDPVVQGATGKDPLALLQALKREVARESAALMYQRITNEQMGKDISQVSARRIDALKKIADIELEMRKIGFDQIDVRSEKIQRIFDLFIDIIRTAAEQTLPTEHLEIFYNRMTTDLDGWEEQAEDLIR